MGKKNIRRDHPLGLYLHIPFCKAKCAYCDFYSLARSEEKMDAYTAALRAPRRGRAAGGLSHRRHRLFRAAARRATSA